MKTSIRSKRFTMGMVLFLIIILLLSVSSAYYLNRLSSKTSAILKENHYSVVYARDMSENLKNINQRIVYSFITNKNPDTLSINKEVNLFRESLKSEKNNITEVGEDTLVSSIESNFNEYSNSILIYFKSPFSTVYPLYLQNKFEYLSQQLMVLSQMNEKAIEEKTDDAKISAHKFALQMTFIGTLCFLIAYAYTFMFSSYFNDRFYKFYDGLKHVVSSNYTQRINLKGDDELSEISLIINEMADKFNKFDKETYVSFEESKIKKEKDSSDLQELKSVLSKIKSLEEQVSGLILNIENKD